jgi:hypothetical protein
VSSMKRRRRRHLACASRFARYLAQVGAAFVQPSPAEVCDAPLNADDHISSRPHSRLCTHGSRRVRPSNRHGRLNGSISRAAIVYFALVFAAGFVLGTIRVLLIAPLWGELPAVLIEAPIMLLVSWLVCGSSVRAFGIRGRSAGLAMGVMAFALLMAAELALSLLGFGRSLAEYLRGYGTRAGGVGLTSQAVFGIMPLLRSSGSRWT